MRGGREDRADMYGFIKTRLLRLRNKANRMSKELLIIGNYDKETFSHGTKFIFEDIMYVITESPMAQCFNCCLRGDCFLLPCERVCKSISSPFTIKKSEEWQMNY